MTTNYFADVRELLKLESNAIAQSADRLDPSQVERVVDLLAKCKGKVVILGVGKSGIIAQKIAATMTSVGTAALYLHPSDALRRTGNRATRGCRHSQSNSGETDEIVAMLPYLQNRHVKIASDRGNVTRHWRARLRPCLTPQ